MKTYSKIVLWLFISFMCIMLVATFVGCKSKQLVVTEHKTTSQIDTKSEYSNESIAKSDFWHFTDFNLDSMELVKEPVLLLTPDSTPILAHRMTVRAKGIENKTLDRKKDSTYVSEHGNTNTLIDVSQDNNSKTEKETMSSIPVHVKLMFAAYVLLVIIVFIWRINKQ